MANSRVRLPHRGCQAYRATGRDAIRSLQASKARSVMQDGEDAILKWIDAPRQSSKQVAQCNLAEAKKGTLTHLTTLPERGPAPRSSPHTVPKEPRLHYAGQRRDVGDLLHGWQEATVLRALRKHLQLLKDKLPQRRIDVEGARHMHARHEARPHAPLHSADLLDILHLLQARCALSAGCVQA